MVVTVCWLSAVAICFVIWIAYELKHAPVIDDGHSAEDKTES